MANAGKSFRTIGQGTKESKQKEVTVVGVPHAIAGLPALLEYIHTGKFSGPSKQKPDFSKEPALKDKVIGIEASPSELKYLNELIDKNLLPTGELNPDRFWVALVDYFRQYGINPVPLDSSTIKRKARELEQQGYKERADELFIPLREKHMRNQIKRKSVDIVIVGRAHMEALANLLKEDGFKVNTIKAHDEFVENLAIRAAKRDKSTRERYAQRKKTPKGKKPPALHRR